MILDMSLDNIGRRYADKLFQESLEGILKSQGLELVKVNQDFASRNTTRSGAYFVSQVGVLVRNVELIAQARVDSLLRAYEKSGVPLDDAAFQEITLEATQYCEQQGRNIVHRLQNQIGQTFGAQPPSGFSEAIAGQVIREVSSVSAHVSRRLSIMRDEAVLSASTAAASRATASPNRSTASTDPKQSDEGSPQSSVRPPSQALPSRPRLYYWRLCEKFGEECYRTWRAELLATFLISVVAYFISKGDDPFAWKNFAIAVISTALTLAAFAVWHLIRTPWLVHHQRIADEESAAHWEFGIFGICVLAGLIGGAYFSIRFLPANPAPIIVKIPAPVPPSIQAQVQAPVKYARRSPVAQTAPSGQPDRVLNDQQSDHLYQRLKDFVADPKNSDLASVTIAPFAYQDRESAHLANQLARIFEDAHWRVLRQGQLPVKLEGAAQHQIPIGIWVLASQYNFGSFLWSTLNEVGLDSQVRPKSDLPPDFNGLIICVGYKEAPIF